MANIKLNYVDTENLEQAIIAIKDAADSLWMAAYSSTLRATLEEHRAHTRNGTDEESAHEFMIEFYSLTSSVLRLISTTVAPLAEGIINDELYIEAKKKTE